MNCPCCSGKLLRHINGKGLYWYCPSCRQTMPASEDMNRLLLQQENSAKLNHQIWLYILMQPRENAA
ncbi:hypothetical protein [Floridanema aerugineum]|uniref:Uncharacterized protein n=1 Tax=Floridaenema aerugineum BLCC-F46 TaxID=3153654 RepID=A0ABV4WYH6_9CYAN